MSEQVFLVKYDPTGRFGTAGGLEELTITVTTASCLVNLKRMTQPIKDIASAYSGVKIEYADVYFQLNAGEGA